MLEYVTGGLIVVTAVFAGLAWIYRRGRNSGMDTACETRIKNKVHTVEIALGELKEQENKEHKEIFIEMKDLHSKIDTIQGSTKVIEKMFREHISDT